MSNGALPSSPEEGGGITAPSITVVAVVLVVAVAVGGGVWFGLRTPDPPPLGGATSLVPPATTPEGSSGVVVHVAGAVADPGLVEVPPGARVADAVAGAGGALTGADLSQINLAAPVLDGSRLFVPWRGEGELPVVAPDDGRVRINAATSSELEELPGVGPVLADRIASYRDTHGPFVAVEDLLDVPGIGEAKLAALRDAVIVP